ncbi:hypothetical protein [Teredinibacter waterburyi]|uniref:hypothetical protein n=1 Tax=Teredinibacter waterburyi TaxID=1500538 RepID=UPI00165FE96F|nr:hypothetical protein [Teredinibacter waterburyi]
MRIFILLIFISSGVLACPENEDEIINREINEIIQLAIDLPELQEYYHLDSFPGRRPLVIGLPVELDLITIDNVTKFGVPAVRYTGSIHGPVFQISNYEVTSWNISFEATYKVEGIRLKYVFEKSKGHWFIKNSEIAEE